MKWVKILQMIQWIYQPFNRQPRKMVKHTQTIRRFLPTKYLSVFDNFVGLALKGLSMNFIKLKQFSKYQMHLTVITTNCWLDYQ